MIIVLVASVEFHRWLRPRITVQSRNLSQGWGDHEPALSMTHRVRMTSDPKSLQIAKTGQQKGAAWAPFSFEGC